MNHLKNLSKLSVFCLLFFSWHMKSQDNNLHLADPTIFQDGESYYLYGTLNDPEIEGEGFVVYQSKDLKNWEGPAGHHNGFALKKGDAFGNTGFWAPQVLKHENQYLMIYTADENIAIAYSDSPLGPFINKSKQALRADSKQIDPFVFQDDDGKQYLYHVRLQEGNRIFVGEMNQAITGIKPESLVECIMAEQGWEDTQSVDWPVAEGPTVFKEGELYYMIYSANDFRNPDYAVGFATARHPLGPWTKSPKNPILHGSMISEQGAGHGDLIKKEDNSYHYVFHTHYSDSQVHPRKTAIVEFEIMETPDGSVIKSIPATFRFLEK